MRLFKARQILNINDGCGYRRLRLQDDMTGEDSQLAFRMTRLEDGKNGFY